MKVVAETIRCDGKEHPELVVAALVHAQLTDVDAISRELTSDGIDARNKNGRAVLRRIAAVDRESDARTVALQDYGRHGV